MSFVPAIPLGGYAGWQFLQRTLDKQAEANASAPAAQRDEQYFRDVIEGIGSAEELVADRRLLTVALTAFGLIEDLPNRAFVQKVLESDSADPASFVNRLADKRYQKLAEAFGFGGLGLPRTGLPGFTDNLLGDFRDRSFEAAIGEQNGSMRLALALERDLVDLAGESSTEATKWFTILGTPSLRSVFETAFSLPSSFGTLDLDRQVEIMRARTERLTGDDSVSQFTNPAAIDDLIQRFFLSEQLQAVQSAAGGNTALSLLQTGQASLNAMLGR